MAADRPRLLARRSELGYTSDPAYALLHEAEAVDKETQRQISTEARLRFAETLSDELARADSRRWANRLKQAEMRARSKGTDVHRYQVEIRRNVVLMEEAIEAG